VKFWQELRRRKVVRVATVYAIAAWLIIQIAVATFPSLYIPPWALSFMIMCVILGFPVALILAWAFELTPEGIRTTKIAQEEKKDTGDTTVHSKKRNWVAYAMGAAIPTVIFGALALFFYIRSGSGPEFTAEDKSIAVLPFDNRSNQEEDQFFTDGIHDDLLTQISRIHGIKTISRTSVMAYRDTTKSMPTIAEELGVTTILEGGVQRSGNRIRINVQLIEAATDAHVWAETYTRELTSENVFEIQNEITRTIADALKVILTPEEIEQLEKLPTENMAALEAYFKGKQALGVLRSGSSWGEAIAQYEKAIDLDPNFALAHAWLGYSIVRNITPFGLSLVEETNRAEPYILKSLELDDRLSDGYVALGRLRHEQRAYEASERAYKKAIELNSNNSEAYVAYADAKWEQMGRPLSQEIADLFLKSYELDPKHDFAQRRLTRSFLASGQLEKALEARRLFVEEKPQSSFAQRELGAQYSRMGRNDDAIVSIRNQQALDPTAQYGKIILSVSYANLGDMEQAIEWLDRYLDAQQDAYQRARWKSFRFKYTGDFAEREQNAINGLKLNPRDPLLLDDLATVSIASGRAEQVRQRWQQEYPSFFTPMPDINASNESQAMSLARVLKATGESEQSNLLIQENLATIRSLGNGSFVIPLDPILHAIAGDDAKTINAKQHFFDAGGSPHYLMLWDELKRFENQSRIPGHGRKAEGRTSRPAKAHQRNGSQRRAGTSS
jgi:TolB-like protein